MMMAALTMVGTMMTGCTSEDLTNGAPQAKNDNNAVTLTTTICLDGGATTRALDAQGKKTFAAGDSIAMIYQDVDGKTMAAMSAVLQATDITDNGKKAKLTFNLENSPKPEGQMRYIYPGAMANMEIVEDVEINDDTSIDFINIENKQDGTLDSLASGFDLAIYDGNFTKDAELPASATLKNQLAIAELTIKDYDGNDITSTITELEIQQGGALGFHYDLTREAAEGPIYVAMRPTPGSDKDSINIKATTAAGTKYERDLKYTLAANNMYPLLVKTFKVVDVSTLNSTNTISGAYTAQNGEMLTGTLPDEATAGAPIHIIIADGDATVTLKNLTIDIESDSYGVAGLCCSGNTTIILEGKNKVKAYNNGYSGIYIENNKTLTITGDGSLEAIGSTNGAGIGGCGYYASVCGNIVISGGNITATGGISAAGIGGCDNSTGTITILGGSVKATGGDKAAGIGGGCLSSCDDITISGGTVIAQGGKDAAGIGGGYDGKCSTITINPTANVTATKGVKERSESDFYSIGLGGDSVSPQRSCGSVHFDSVEVYDGSNWTEVPTNGNTYDNLKFSITTKNYDNDTWILQP